MAMRHPVDRDTFEEYKDGHQQEHDNLHNSLDFLRKQMWGGLVLLTVTLLGVVLQIYITAPRH